jgi:hypothetical protein
LIRYKQFGVQNVISAEGTGMTNSPKFFDQLKSWEVARLIPTLPESKREERATSVLLATFRAVPIFALDMLKSAGAPTGKRLKIHCLTEVVPKGQKGPKLRPDGIVFLDTGRSTWSAIVESKVGPNELNTDQIESYVALAKSLQCDAVITISNQFSALPTHHPVAIQKGKLGKLGLYHFSWLSLVSKAVLLAGNKQVDDPEQAFLLDELIRYLQSPKSGVSLMTQIGPGWKRTCGQVLQGVQLLKSADEVKQAVTSWEQLTRYLALQLTLAVNKPVSLYLTRKQAQNPESRVKDHVAELVTPPHFSLTDYFEIPNAAGKLKITADFSRRALDFSMMVVSPKDKSFATACVNWLLRQLKADNLELLIRANWPGRTPATMATIRELREEPSQILPPGCKSLPTSLEVVRVMDLAGKFQQKRKFVEIAESEMIRFYEDVGQHLKNWVPPPPKIKKTPTTEGAEEPAREEFRIPGIDE